MRVGATKIKSLAAKVPFPRSGGGGNRGHVCGAMQ